MVEGHVTKEKLGEWIETNWSATQPSENKPELEFLTWDPINGQQKVQFETGAWEYAGGEGSFLIIKVGGVEILHMHLNGKRVAFHITRGGLLRYRIV